MNVTEHNSSDVTTAANGLDSLMNVFIALVLAVLILTTAIGKWRLTFLSLSLVRHACQLPLINFP